MPRGFAHPYLILALLVVLGTSAAFYAGSKHIAGIVLGARSKQESIYQKQTDSIKVTVISPNSSWDLLEYLCATEEECRQSPTSGRWWATVGGDSTTLDGHEIFIEQSETWANYNFIKFYVKPSSGSPLLLKGTQETYAISDLSLAPYSDFVFATTSGR